jgi:hypothetical protein
MKARLALLATISVAVGLTACGNPTSIRASFPTTVDSLSLFALSGTPPTYPSALAVLSRQIVRVDGFAGFDVAFDINAAGNAVISPVKLVVVSQGGSRPVGLLRVPGTFETALEAPKTGYEADSSLVLAAGEVVIVQSAHNVGNGDLCLFAINPNIYAKIAVDSINLASRTIFFRMGLDPNCGFRSFVAGIPTS